MNFNKREFDSFRIDVEKALQEIAKKHNVDIKTGKIKYSDFDFTMDLKVTKNEVDCNGEQKKFEQYCMLFGFKPEHYNAEFTLHGDKFILVGFNPSCPKNSCSIKKLSDGKTYKINEEAVQRALMVAR